MDKTKAQGKAIKEKYKGGEINETEKKHLKEGSGYRMKKSKGEGEDKMSSDGDSRVKCKHCGK